MSTVPDDGYSDDAEALENDALDSAIREAFADDVASSEPPRSVLCSLESARTVPRVVLREPSESAPMATRPSATKGSEPAPPRHVDRYQVAGEIARGGIGSILKARDVDLGRDVALKVLLARHRGNSEMTARFLEEAQIGGQLEHPGIVPVHEIGLFSDERPYFSMKLIKGQTLGELLKSRSDSGEDRQRFLGIFERICQTLAYAHTRGVIHRDLKPANVMVGAFGEVQVMDWGLAKVILQGSDGDGDVAARVPDPEAIVRTTRSEDDDSASLAGVIMGTPAYMPPEQARGAVDDLSERSDVFGLGAILCQILTGNPPYAGHSLDEICKQARDGELGDAFRSLEDCGADRVLIDLTCRCLAVDPDERPRSAVELAASVRSYLESLESRRRNLELRAARTRSRLTIVTSVLIALCVAVGAYYWLAGEQERREASRRASIAAALDEVTGSRDAARVSGGLSVWTAALQEAEHAVMLAQEGSEAELLRRAERLRSELATEVKDQSAIALLEDLRQSTDGTPEEMHDLFEELFSSYGIDLQTLPPAQAAERIQRSSIATQLVLGLDQWALLDGPGRRSRSLTQKIFNVVQLADIDPGRRELRRAVNDRDSVALERLAGELSVDSEPTTYELLARALARVARDLKRVDLRAKETEVWRQAQRLYPGDFWIQVGLARALDRTEPAEALQYARAAVALRPQSSFAHGLLGTLLATAGQVAAGVAELHRSIEIDPRFHSSYHALGGWIERQGESLPETTLTALEGTLEEIVAFDHPPRDALELLARLFHRQGARARAVRMLELAEITAVPRHGSSERRGTLSLGRREQPNSARRGSRRRDRAERREEERSEGSRRWPRFRRRRESRISSLLKQYREDVLPDLVSYASLDAALGGAVTGLAETQNKTLRAFRDYHRETTETEAKARLEYLDGRLLQQAGRDAEAVADFARAVELDPTAPTPILRLGESLANAGQTVAAERTLRGALERDELVRYAELWKLWGHVSLGALARSPTQLLRAWPNGPATVEYASDLHSCLTELAGGNPLRINCGGDEWSDADGKVWGRDRFFGLRSFVPRPYRGKVKPLPGAPPLPSGSIYETRRGFGRGSGYSIPLPTGAYRVRLHFAAPYGWTRKLRFDIVVEGRVAETNYSPPQTTPAAASRWVSVVEVRDAALDLQLEPTGVLSGIEVEPLVD